MIELEEAQLPDVVTVTKLVGLYWEENLVHKSSRFDAKSTMFKVRDGILDGNNLVLVAYWLGEPAGVLWCRIAENLGNMELFATDRLLYVRPEHRDKQILRKFQAAFEEWVKGKGIKDVRISTFGGVNNEGMRNFLESLGYKLCGETFVKKS